MLQESGCWLVCKQHAKSMDNQLGLAARWAQIGAHTKQAQARWEVPKQEQSNMDEAMRRSMVEDPEVLRKRKLSRARVNERLKVMGLRRLDTVNDGSCQFAAVVQISNLDFSIAELQLAHCCC